MIMIAIVITVVIAGNHHLRVVYQVDFT